MSTTTIIDSNHIDENLGYEPFDSSWRLDGYIYNEAFGPRDPNRTVMGCQRIC